MATVLTAVPDRPAPAPGRVASLLLPLADLTMAALLSRPETGSLRRTWVTPATLVLAVATAAIAIAAAVVLGIRGGGLLIAAGALTALAVCALSVGIVGVDQRRRG